MRCSASREASARVMMIIGSALPCAMKIGVCWLAGLRSLASLSASGRYPDRAMMPASLDGYRRPVCNTIAQPCENPASTILSALTPRSTSRWMSAAMASAERWMPASSSCRCVSVPSMSYQAGMTYPPLMVTGIRGALGKTKRIGAHPVRSSSGTIAAKSLPSAPRPWSQMTAAVGSGPLVVSIQGRMVGMVRCLRCVRAGSEL